MPSQEPDNLYRLANFAETVLLPAVELAHWDNTWVRASALEAFMWLDLGVKIGAFPEAHARTLALRVSREVQASLEALSETTLIHSYVRQLALRSFESGEYSLKDDGSYVNSTTLVPVFESLMYCAVEHGRAPHTKDLFSELWMQSDEHWEQARLVLGATGQSSGAEPARIVEAFASSLGYWLEMDDFLQRVLDDDRGDASSRIALVGDAAAIQIWKFNFMVPKVRERIHAAGEMTLAVLRRTEPQIAFALGRDVRESLQTQVDSLMDRWQSRMEYAVGLTG